MVTIDVILTLCGVVALAAIPLLLALRAGTKHWDTLAGKIMAIGAGLLLVPLAVVVLANLWDVFKDRF